MGSTCRKLKSHRVSQLGQLSRWLAKCTDSWDFKCDSYTLHLYYIYPHYPLKCKEAIQKKTLERFLQHTHLLERELLILRWEIFVVSSPSPSHCYTLRGDFYPNTIHIYSECREWFGAWKVLEICQKKPVRLGRCNWAVLQGRLDLKGLFDIRVFKLIH